MKSIVLACRHVNLATGPRASFDQGGEDVVHIHLLQIESRAVQYRPHLIAGELVIDGVPLLEQISRASGRSFDVASPLTWMPAKYLREWATRLVGNASPVLPSGRCEVLICPECGDLGCGCVSCVVSREGEYVVWSELGWETDYDPDDLSRFPMGGFRFRADDLTGALGLQRVEKG